jgi:hypothetical protein
LYSEDATIQYPDDNETCDEEVEFSKHNAFLDVIEIWPALAADILTLPEEEGPDFQHKLRYVSVKIFWAVYQFVSRRANMAPNGTGITLLNTVMHRMSSYTLNECRYHPLSGFDMRPLSEFDIQLWYYIIDTWMTDDGCRMRLVNATTYHPYRNRNGKARRIPVTTVILLSLQSTHGFSTYTRCVETYLQQKETDIRHSAPQKILELKRVLSIWLKIIPLVEITKTYAFHQSIIDLDVLQKAT